MLSKPLFFLGLILCLFSSSLAVGQKKVINGTKFYLINSLNTTRENEVAVFTKTAFTSLTGNVINSQYPVINTEKGTVIPSQVDDLDGDGVWDEIAMLVSIPANGKLALRVNYSINKPKYKSLTHARLGKSLKRDDNFIAVTEENRPINHSSEDLPLLYQNEGPAIENTKVAFRFLYDTRNQIDVIGKRTSNMLLDSIGISENIQKLRPWGMDILEEGNSFGAGSIALIDIRTDSVYKIGGSVKSTYKLISDGPLRSIFRLTYSNWQIQGQSLKLTQTIILSANTYAYESRVKIEGTNNPNLILITGISKRFTKNMSNTFANEDIYMMATHDKQSANDDFLGLGILASKDYDPYAKRIQGNSSTSDSYCLFLGNGSFEFNYQVAACWELSNKEFSSRKGFQTYLLSLADRIAYPISLSK